MTIVPTIQQNTGVDWGNLQGDRLATLSENELIDKLGIPLDLKQPNAIFEEHHRLRKEYMSAEDQVSRDIENGAIDITGIEEVISILNKLSDTEYTNVTDIFVVLENNNFLHELAQLPEEIRSKISTVFYKYVQQLAFETTYRPQVHESIRNVAFSNLHNINSHKLATYFYSNNTYPTKNIKLIEQVTDCLGALNNINNVHDFEVLKKHYNIINEISQDWTQLGFINENENDDIRDMSTIDSDSKISRIMIKGMQAEISETLHNLANAVTTISRFRMGPRDSLNEIGYVSTLNNVNEWLEKVARYEHIPIEFIVAVSDYVGDIVSMLGISEAYPISSELDQMVSREVTALPDIKIHSEHPNITEFTVKEILKLFPPKFLSPLTTINIFDKLKNPILDSEGKLSGLDEGQFVPLLVTNFGQVVKAKIDIYAFAIESIGYFPKDIVRRALPHEIGHLIHSTLPISDAMEYEEIVDTHEVVVTAYVEKAMIDNPSHKYIEDFAESLMLFLFHPGGLKKVSPERHEFFKKFYRNYMPPAQLTSIERRVNHLETLSHILDTDGMKAARKYSSEHGYPGLRLLYDLVWADGLMLEHQ